MQRDDCKWFDLSTQPLRERGWGRKTDALLFGSGSSCSVGAAASVGTLLAGFKAVFERLDQFLFYECDDRIGTPSLRRRLDDAAKLLFNIVKVVHTEYN